MKFAHHLFFSSLIFLFTSSIVAQYQNIRVDDPSSSSPEEVTIAINPLNPNTLAAGANINHFFRSTDGGSTWSTSYLSSTLGVWGDPAVLFDNLGNLYYGHLSNPISGYWIDRIVVQKSTDNGLTWNDGAGVGFVSPKNQDKEWLAVDLTSSPYNGNVYMTWTEFDDYGSSNPNDSSRIRFSKSTDQGNTWTNAITISDVSGNCIDSDNTTEGAVPCVGPNGEIFVAWAGPEGLVFDKSTDAGITWGSDIFITDIPGGWDFDVSGISRCNGLPITMCDVSNLTYHGNTYVVWSDQRYGSTNTDIFLCKSTDAGETWSLPKKVNDDVTTRQQFFVWSTIDQSTGTLWFIFYDRRNTTGSSTDVYIAKSTDGGETFENFKVSQSPFIPTAGVFFGDYTNIAAFEGKIFPIWMRLHNGELTVWTAPVVDSTVIPVELISFKGIVNNGKVILSWETATELNNHGFIVERKTSSKDNLNENWREIGFVEGNGTSVEKHHYSFIDFSELNGSYSYRLKQLDFNGTYEYSNIIEIDVFAVSDYALYQNYPNPFNPITTISFQLPEAVHATLKIYDTLGNEVKTLFDGILNSGVHELIFDAKDFSSGMYLYRLITEKFQQTQKMILLR